MATAEKWKSGDLKISTMVSRIQRKVLKTNHPLQRLSEQYNKATKDNLIASILNNDPIPAIIIAEQVINGVSIQWLLDGKQRCTTIYSYMKNDFRIGRNIERPIVKYRVTSTDQDGNETDGYVEFDIRGKKYESLPMELQEQFGEFCLQTTLFMDCSDEDIEYHIRRYNMGKPMTAAQKGITYLGEEFAKVVKELAKHSFFRNSFGDYSIADRRNGNIDRIITESIMGINYLNNWNPNQQKLCAFLKEHATVSAFDTFQKYLDRIVEVFENTNTKEYPLFSKSNSFIFFMLFDRFDRLHLDDDEKFLDFLNAFSDELHEVEIDGMSYDRLVAETKPKDKTTVLRKIAILEQLMCNYFNVEKMPVQQLKMTNRDLERNVTDVENHSFMQKLSLPHDKVQLIVANYHNLATGKYDPDIQNFVDTYEYSDGVGMDILSHIDTLEDWDNIYSFNRNSKIFSAEYMPVILTFIHYTFNEGNENETEAQEWFEIFADNLDKEDRFTSDPLKNYQLMMDQFNEYLEYQKNKSA